MNKYYLFIIQNKNYKIYKNKSYVLYKMLEKLYNLKAYDFSYGFNIYNALCDTVNTKLLEHYINSHIKHQKNGKLIKIKNNNIVTYLNINRTSIIMYTNKKKNYFFKVFNIYNPYIFVCDFQSKDYFWLNEYLKNRQI